MTACVVVVPMLGRGEAAQPLADSLAASLQQADARLLFVCNDLDRRTIRACAATGADLSTIEGSRQPGDYARKINLAARLTSEEWIFTGASDLVFQPGWLDAAIRAGQRLRGVVGTNDLGNPLVKRGHMSTHSLVHRTYVECAVVDQPGNLYCTLYDHNYCDMELVDYAKRQGRWAFARDAIVEHLHPDWRKARMDSTYERSKAHFEDDKKLWLRRQMIWGMTRQQLRIEQRRRLRRAV